LSSSLPKLNNHGSLSLN